MWSLNEIVRLLNTHHQRASYGAVAGVLRIIPRGLMAGRSASHQYSWIVAKSDSRKNGSRRGWPTGYTTAEIHPECLRQIQTNPDNFIEDEQDLEHWLKVH